MRKTGASLGTAGRDPQPAADDAHFASKSPDAVARAAYIRDMVLELRSMAEKYNLIVLAYFLDMAHEEASDRARAADRSGNY